MSIVSIVLLAIGGLLALALALVIGAAILVVLVVNALATADLDDTDHYSVRS